MSATVFRRSVPGKPEFRPGMARLLTALWALAVLVSFGGLLRYQTTPGERPSVPSRWPSDADLPAVPGRPTLVLFAHPCCPCTRATLNLLRGLLPRYEGRLTAWLSACRPVDRPDGWNELDFGELLAGVPQIEVRDDPEGRAAQRFGVKTSGHVVLYGASGDLLFSGGICSSRGHEGDSVGLQLLREALESELAGEPVPFTRGVPVFGCALSASEGGRP